MRYFTLNTFYKSDEWWDLLQIIKTDPKRLDDDGNIICAFCGKPIIRAYDCIGHHVIELTEENVNDRMISLNEENVELVHHRCHNKIHNKLGKLYSRSYRKVYLVYGSPLSGKSSWVRESMNAGDLVVDMDNIWECISGCNRYTKPDRLKGIAFGVRDYLLESVRLRRGKWQNAYVIGGYPLISERERLVRELDAELIFIDTSREECIRRLMESEDGRDKLEWTKYIDDWWSKYAPRAYQ